MPSTLRAASPKKRYFDPWNSASTGHQIAESRLAGSTSWRDSRSAKLASQFSSGMTSGGGKRISDTVGAESRHFGRDGRLESGAVDTKTVEGARLRGGIKGNEPDLKEYFTGEERAFKKRKVELSKPGEEEILRSTRAFEKDEDVKKKGIFTGLTFYINGLTAPIISDHKLKYEIVENGGELALGLARRTVTHVIIGQPNTSTSESLGAGGGLAISKIQKEASRGGKTTVKYVTASWVVESLKAGKRLAEREFAPLNTAGAGSRSVLGMWKSKAQTKPQTEMDPPASNQPEKG